MDGSKLKEIFESLKGSEGTITSDLVCKLLRSAGYDPTEKELLGYISALDPNKRGKIGWNAIEALAPSLRQPFTEAELKEAFAYIDKNKDHKLSIEEFKSIMMTQGDKMTADELDNIFQDMDKDGSGFIDYEEFVSRLTQK